MIKDYNIAPDAGIHPSKILGGALGTKDYFHVAPSTSAYWVWLQQTVPANRLFTSLALAHVHMTADRGDTALVYPGAYTQSTTALTWSKDQCHIIGVGPRQAMMHPTYLQNGNADATPTGGNYVFSANECQISNIRFRHLGATQNLVNVTITGDNNVFEDVHFHNMANTALAATTGALGVFLNAGDNCVFRRCVFGGLDIERTASAADFTVDGAVNNVFFYDCMWTADLDATADASHAFIEVVAAGDIAMLAYFERPSFINAGAAADQLPDCITVSASLTGLIVIKDPFVVGALDIADQEEMVYIHGPAPTATTTGIAINPNVA
jgi:hypothetical protein